MITLSGEMSRSEPEEHSFNGIPPSCLPPSAILASLSVRPMSAVSVLKTTFNSRPQKTKIGNNLTCLSANKQGYAKNHHSRFRCSSDRFNCLISLPF